MVRVRPFCSLGRLRTQKLIRLVDRFKYGLWKLYTTKLIHYGFASPENIVCVQCVGGRTRYSGHM